MSVSANAAARKRRWRYASRYLLCLGAVLVLTAMMAPAGLTEVSPEPGNNHGAPSAAPVEERFGAASSHIKLYDPVTMEGELDAMDNAGIGWLRCDFAWYDLEPDEGSWNLAGTDLLVQEAEERGIEVLGILGTSPSWANGGMGWNYPPTDIDAWRNYVGTVCSRYQGRVSAWEVWNEENIESFWQPEPDPAAYLDLLEAASEEIRSADPQATVVMGGVAGLGSDFLFACLEGGAADHIDAIAYHPYAETIGVEGQPEEDRLRPKESLCRALVEFVHGLVSQYTSDDIQVWLTEVGWTTCEESPPGVDEDTQASYMLRTLINYASVDVDRFFWFNLRDTLLNDWDHYGLLENGFTPRPAYGYYSTFEEVLAGAVPVDIEVVSACCSDPATLEAHCFELPGGDLVYAVWKSDDADDSLTFTVAAPSHRNPETVDLATAERQHLAGVSRDTSGNVTVTGLAVGKKPVILVMDKVTAASISPSQAYQHTISMVIDDLSGSGFQPGAAVKLEKDGRVIYAYNVQAVSDTQITCTLGFFGAEPGVYDVVVTNPDGSWARLEGGFTVISLCGAGGGTAVLALGLALGLISAAGSLRLRSRRRRR